MKRTTQILVACFGLVLVGVGCGDDDAFSGDLGNNINNANNLSNISDYNPDEAPNQGETYEGYIENDFVDTATEPTSTFSIDVDAASYTLMRRDLNNGVLPNPDGARTEEYVNFFDYDYAEPAQDQPFSINLEVAPSKFGDGLHLLQVGLQGREIDLIDMRSTNLVLLIDISGSMQSQLKLPMVKESVRTMVEHLRPDDRIAIVTYAGDDRIALPSTAVSDASTILSAVDQLTSAGSTNGEAGIVKAYDIAEQNFIEGGNNRVVIMTDGDFNVGRTGDQLVQLVRDYRDKEISLTSVGYGRGNFNDATMESLARDGNGNYFYIDSQVEAQRIFGEGLPSTFEVIAADVKIQVEFADDTVKRYRLVGYENRLLDNEDFEDDSRDAGEIGPGHTVTAFYEIEIDETVVSETGLLAEVRVRHKAQYGEASTAHSQGIKLSQVQPDFESASQDLKFAAAVVEFAEVLRGSMHTDGTTVPDLRDLAAANTKSRDERVEFVELVDIALGLLP